MKMIITVARVFLLLSLGLYGCTPQVPDNNLVQTTEQAPGKSSTQAITPAANQEEPQHTIDTSSSQTPAILFIENVGQFDPQARFQAKTDLGTAYLANDVIWLTLLEETNSPASEEGTINIAPSGQNGQQAIATPAPPEENSITGVHLRLTFVDSNSNARVEGFNPQSTKVSFFTGNDEENRQVDVPVWGGVRYVDFYPNYDLEITSAGSQWTWRLVQKETTSFQPTDLFQAVNFSGQASNADEEIRLRVDGAESLSLNENDLMINTVVGNVNLPLPLQGTVSSSTFSAAEATVAPELDGNEIILPLETTEEAQSTSSEFPNSSKVNLALINMPGKENRFRQINQLNSPLIGMPAPASEEIVFSTFLGGSLAETINDVVMGDTGAVYVTGFTNSLDFPTTPGTFSAPGLDLDIIVSKLGANGDQLEWSTQIGGSAADIGSGIALDNSNHVYVTGRTLSTDLPITPGAFDSVNNDSEAFVIKLDPSGTNLDYSTYLGTGGTQGFDIVVGNNGEAYVTGQTASTSFPVTSGAFDETHNGDWDGFVSQLDSTGSNLVFSTFLGGSSADCEIGGDLYECSIALDASGAVYISGQTLSADFPTTNGAFDRTHNGNYDLFVTKLQVDGSSLVYSTFIGGTDSDSCESECALAVDANGFAYLSGATLSTNFPTTSGAYDRTHNGDWDAVVVKVASDGESLVYSTYLGGSGKDTGRGIALVNERVVITGETTSTNFPVSADPFQSTYGGGLRDAYIAILNSDGRAVDYSSYLGGSVNERGLGIFAAGERIAVAGNTSSGDFPLTAGAYDQSLSGVTDGYIFTFIPGSGLVNGPVVQELSVVSSASAGDECTDCIGCSVNNTQGSAGGPINTRTGGYDYTMTDLSFVTTAGELSFVRTYSSLALDLSTNLSPGWTHNQDMRLIFPDDPGGQDGVVLLKSRSANRYSFLINTDDTYTASPGIRAALTRDPGTPIRYTVIDSAKNVYTFDEDGKLTTFENPQEQSWSYTYTFDGYLDQVSANNGFSYLSFDYDSIGQMTSVTDHTGREVSFGYDSAGDLVTVTDVLNQTWTFTYDSGHHFTQVTAPDSTIMERTEYDSQGRAVRQYDGEDNLVVELTYNGDGTTTVTDALGNEQIHTYDSRGTLVGETNAVNAEMETVYGDNFQPM